jgi:hypothetical protein
MWHSTRNAEDTLKVHTWSNRGAGKGIVNRRLLTKLVLLSVRDPLVFSFFLHEGFSLIFLLTQKYWQETHLLDPLTTKEDREFIGHCKVKT